MLDIGRVLVTYHRIANGDPDSWFRAWRESADDLYAQATAASGAGNQDTACALFLGASEAYDQALSFIDGMPDQSVLLPTFRRHRECWDRFIASSQGRHVPVPVPYEGDSMPGYLLRPDASGAPRPTVVVSNGSDGSLAGLWATVRPSEASHSAPGRTASRPPSHCSPRWPGTTCTTWWKGSPPRCWSPTRKTTSSSPDSRSGCRRPARGEGAGPIHP